MKNFNFKTLLLAIGLVVASVQPSWADDVCIHGSFDDWIDHAVKNNGDSYTYKNVEAGSYDFELHQGASYQGNNDLVGDRWHGNISAHGFNNSNHQWLTLPSKSDVEIKRGDNGWDLIVTATPIKRWVIGSFWGEAWQHKEMSREGNTLSFSIINVAAGSYTFRLASGESSWEQDCGWNQINQDCVSGVTAEDANSDNSIKVILAKPSDVTITYDAYSNKICITATDPINGIAGSFNDWNATTNPLNYTDNVAQTTIALSSGNTYKFKVRVNSDWRGNSGTMTRSNCSGWTMSTDVGSECTITPDLTGNYIFIYDKSTGQLTVKYPSTLTLDGNGGEPASQNLTLYIGDEMSSTKFTQPTKTGYDYKSFTITQNSDNNLINTDGTFAANTTYTTSKKWSYVNGTGKTVYAKWAPHTYSITYKDQGGGDYSGTKSGLVTSHTYATATNLVDGSGKKGYTFIGWYTDINCTDGNKVTTLGATDYSSDITLYAKWQANTTNITINKNDGTDGTVSATAVYDGTISAVTGLSDALRTRTGYTFSEINTTASGNGTTIITWTGTAWAFAANAGSGKYTNNANPPVWQYTDNTDLTLNIRWTANQYTVSFYNADDAVSPSQTLNVTFDAEIGSSSVTKPIKSGYIFGGYFTGKGGTGTQLTDANGNLLEVAGYFEKQSTKLYWKHADNVNVYAAWSEEKTCSLTFGITDGTQATNERGSLSITFGGNEYKVGGLNTGNPSSATIENIPSGTELTINYKKRSGSGVNATTPDSWWTTVTKTSSAPVTLKSTDVYSFIVTADASIYLWSTLNQYEFAHSVNPAAGGAITTDNDTYIAGPAVQRVLTANPNDGYEFSSWTLSENVVKSGSQTETTNPLTITLKNSSAESVTANFTAITYDITYNNVAPSEHTNPSSYTIESETITLQDASRDNYTFDGWFDAETDGNKVTEIAQGSFGDKTLWARWHETMHSVNIVAMEGIESVEPGGATDVGNVTPVTITAVVKAGYTWKNWTTNYTSRITFGNANENPTTIKATESANVNANATENLSTVTISVNDGNMGSVDYYSEVKVGVSTSRQVTATPKTGYKFVNWTLTGGARLKDGSSLTDATININGDGNSTAGTATATFEEDLSTPWELHIWVGPGDNDWYTYQFSKKSGESSKSIAYYTLQLNSGEHDMELIKDGNTYYKNNGTFTSTNCTDWVFKTTETRGKINCTITSEYTFIVNFIDSDPKVSVIYPGETSHTVTVDNGETETLVDVKEVTETPLVAKQYLNGMRFDGWVVTNSEGVVQDNMITINHPENYSTHMHGAKADGLIVKATYTTQGIVYLNKQYIKNNWAGDVYVYFYKGAYWDEGSKGSGSKTDGGNCISIGKQMTRVSDKSDIYYYDYSNDNLTNRAEYIAFLDKPEDGYANFVACQAIYRGDFQECSPMFVPRDWKSYYNTSAQAGQAVYYQEGYWRTYGSTEAGLSLVFWKGEAKTIVPFTSESKNDNTFTAKITISDVSNDTYFKLRCCEGDENNQDYWYGCKTGMSATSCTNYRFYSGNNTENANCGIGLTSTGDYVFILSLADGQVFVSVEYPLSNGDYRLVSVTDGKVHDNGMFYKSSTDRVDTASFFVTKDHTSLVKLQECTNATAVPAKWEDVAGKSINTSDYTTGIYNFTFTQSSESSKEIAKLGEYKGNFYIRTAIAAGGWDAYKGSDDNLLPYIEYGLDKSQPFNFTHAYTNWVEANKNVKFCIANDYSLCISDTLVGDNILGEEDNADWLTKGANVRFMWNKNTNALSRAYLAGSNEGEDFLYIQAVGDGKLYNLSGDEETTINFTDKFDWVYQLDVKAGNGATVDVIATYNSKPVTLVDNRLIFSTTGADDSKAQMNLVYDFKTNRIVAAWRPSGEITSQYTINTDIMLMRNGQQQADQMKFSGSGEITGEPKTVYGAIQFNKSLMETSGSYDRSIFWISFPFDVRLNDVFGLGQYGKYWIIRYYDGAERAKKGWFQETKTFWKTVSIEEREHGGTDGKGFVMKANEGYNLVLDYTAVLKDLYPNDATENYLFFPSMNKISNISGLTDNAIEYAPLTCTITSPEDRRNEDSNWRVIGVPSYADPGTLTASEGIKFYYAWNSWNNTLGVGKVQETNPRGGSNEGTFQSMHAYMVQFAGTINWKTMTITPTPATAPLFAQTEKEEYSLRLELQQEGKKVDQAYVDLTDDATENFDLNLDITKLMYSTSQIYSFIGQDKVAANSLPVKDVTVPLCVTAAADGTYTIALPDGTDGLNVTLYDAVEGQEHNFLFGGYTLTLTKGEYNNRFMLNITTQKAPTSIEADGQTGRETDGKTMKFLRNGNIYLINSGRVYNATGAKLR